jgi:pimeloyl-ACP methyl ester carboxylesterase
MQLSIPQGRQWLIHGADDDTVPSAFSRDYVASKQKRDGKDKEDVHLLEIPAAGHYDLIDPRTKAWKQIEQTVLQLLS